MKYADEVKKQAIAQHQRGETAGSICCKLGISRSTLYRWVNAYARPRRDVPQKASRREYNSLRLQAERQAKIIAILKAADCTVHAPLQDRLRTLEALYGEYDVKSLCAALEVDRGTFYNHIKRNKRSNGQLAKRRELYRELVEDIFNEYHQIYGAEKITIILRQQGHRVSRKYISEIMRECGLVSIRNTAKTDYQKTLEYHNKKNILKQRFHAEKPNQTWVSDVTTLKINNVYIYICAIIDLFSRKVVGYHTSKRNSTQLITYTFRTAFVNRKASAGLVFHSDRGAQYTSYTLRNLLIKLQVTQSFSRPGVPHDNAVAESFFFDIEERILL